MSETLEVNYKNRTVDPQVSHVSKLLWLRMFDWSCKFGVEDCIYDAMEYFDKFSKEIDIPVDVKQTALCTGLRMTQGNWGFLWRQYRDSNSATEQSILMTAMGCTKTQHEVNVSNLLFSFGTKEKTKTTNFPKLSVIHVCDSNARHQTPGQVCSLLQNLHRKLGKH